MNHRISEIFHHLAAAHQTLSVAESCTGGGLANEITAVAGISRVFLGSVTTYSNESKENLLHVPNHLLVSHGAVSEEVALLMAKNCREVFSSTWAISTTGIAGPTGGSIEKPVGLVFIGLAGPKALVAKSFVFADISRLQHRKKTIEQSLLLLKQHF